MNKLLLLTGGLALASFAPPAYKTYHNQRFGYRLDYPAYFRPQPEPKNGNGRRFLSSAATQRGRQLAKARYLVWA